MENFIEALNEYTNNEYKYMLYDDVLGGYMHTDNFYNLIKYSK